MLSCFVFLPVSTVPYKIYILATQILVQGTPCRCTHGGGQLIIYIYQWFKNSLWINRPGTTKKGSKSFACKLACQASCLLRAKNGDDISVCMIHSPWIVDTSLNTIGNWVIWPFRVTVKKKSLQNLWWLSDWRPAPFFQIAHVFTVWTWILPSTLLKKAVIFPRSLRLNILIVLIVECRNCWYEGFSHWKNYRSRNYIGRESMTVVCFIHLLWSACAIDAPSIELKLW